MDFLLYVWGVDRNRENQSCAIFSRELFDVCPAFLLFFDFRPTKTYGEEDRHVECPFDFVGCSLALIAFLLSVWQTVIFVSQNSLTSTKAFFCLGCVLIL